MAGRGPGRAPTARAAGLLLLGVAVAWWACGDDPKRSAELPYDLLCPSAGGDCESADGPLRVGAAMRDITPAIVETFCDCGDDGICPDAGPRGVCETAAYPGPDSNELDGEFDGHPIVLGGAEPFDDQNGNSFFDAVWIAGYGNARPAQGVHDPQWARAVVIEKGSTALALVSVDLVGYFYDEVLRIREAVRRRVDVDLVLVGATHTHSGPDSVGIWGYDEGTTGTDPAYMEAVRGHIVDAVVEAAQNLEAAKVTIAVGDVGAGHPDPQVVTDAGVNNLIRDLRDPVVIDETLRVLHFQRASNDETIATVVNLSNHPEVLCGDNSYLSSDFTHYLREALENGIQRGGVDEPGLGGMAMLINGAVGGMQSPLRSSVVDIDGTVYDQGSCNRIAGTDDPYFDRVRAFGELFALDAFAALDSAEAPELDPDLSFATRRMRLPIENWGYHAMFLTGVFYGACETTVGTTVRPRRCIYDFDSSRQITDDNLPQIETEMAVINLGPLQALTMPGELLPEWWLGGFDGSRTGPAQSLVDEWQNRDADTPQVCSQSTECPGAPLADGRTCGADNCACIGGVCRHEDYNPPNIAQAPAGPYLADRMTRPVKAIFGLMPDELGYIIPTYNFQLDDRLPYVEEAPGHYEETNSIGAGIGPAIEREAIELLKVAP